MLRVEHLGPRRRSRANRAYRRQRAGMADSPPKRRALLQGFGQFVPDEFRFGRALPVVDAIRAGSLPDENARLPQLLADGPRT